MYLQLLFSILTILIWVAVGQQPFDSHVIYPETQDVYEFWLDIDMKLTMAVPKDQSAIPVFFNISDGIYYKHSSTKDQPKCGAKVPVMSSLDQMIVGDGLHRTAIVVNGSLPGPTLTILQNSTVIIHVRNSLPVDEVSLHWHGLDMKNFFFMDGVGRVSICPIQPGETFVYKFYVPDHPGTYFYHGHAGPHRSDGLWGALIVLPRPAAEGDSTFPEGKVEDNFLIINDWYPYKAQWYYDQILYDGIKFSYGYMNMTSCYFMTKNLAGQIVGLSQYHSALINGRGWYNMADLESANHRLPIYRLNVSSANQQRVRIINSGMSYAFRVSIGGHLLEVVAVDAFEVKSVIASEVVVSPGERYDVILMPIRATKGAFRITIQTLEALDFFDKPMELHYNFGLLIYDNYQPTSPVPKINHNCSNSEPCIVVNCPFQDFPKNSVYKCKNLEDLEALNLDSQGDEVLQPSFTSGFEEYHLNFRFEEHGHTVNGIQNVFPISPPFLYPDDEAKTIIPCYKDQGLNSWDPCTHIVNLQIGNVVQLVIYAKGEKNKTSNNKIDPTIGFGHPFHLHGHHFYVVKQAWPLYDNNSLAKQVESDITCNHYFCNDGNWSNPSWANGNIKGINLKTPILKDTVWVPFGGYVIIRFKADNPGLWFSHCHLVTHHLDGMGLIFKEGSYDQMPQPPDDYPVCGAAIPMGPPTPKPSPSNPAKSPLPPASMSIGIIVGVGVACLVVGLLIGLLTSALKVKISRKRASKEILIGDDNSARTSYPNKSFDDHF